MSTEQKTGREEGRWSDPLVLRFQSTIEDRDRIPHGIYAPDDRPDHLCIVASLSWLTELGIIPAIDDQEETA